MNKNNEYRSFVYCSKANGKFLITIKDNYNNKKEIFALQVKIKKDVTSITEVVIGSTKNQNKYFISETKSLFTISKDKVASSYKKIFQVDNIVLDECLKKIIDIKLTELNNSFKTSPLELPEIFDRIVWSTEKISRTVTKDVYINKNKIVLFNLGKNIGHEFEKIRPCIVWKSNSKTSIIIPLTSTCKPEFVEICHMNRTSYVRIDSMKEISNKRMVKFTKSSISKGDRKRIEEALFNYYI